MKSDEATDAESDLRCGWCGLGAWHPLLLPCHEASATGIIMIGTPKTGLRNRKQPPGGSD
jgi:hypothetical protein